MYDITLVATSHSDLGRCNSDNLYEILEEVNPQVLFEELSINFSKMYYSDSFDLYTANSLLVNRRLPTIPLEVKSVKKYRQRNDIEIVPVDIDVRQKLSEHQDEIFFMFNTFLKNEHYQKLDIEINNSVAQEGFSFLNSRRFLDLSLQKQAIEESIIESDIQKNRLNNIYKLFYDQQHYNRENEMLQNIYNYSKEHPYH